MIMQHWKLWLCLCLLLGMSGCRTKTQISAPTEPIPERSLGELKTALANHNYHYSWFAGEASIKVKSPEENINGKTYIRIRRDSVLWSVVKKLGVEGGRILVTPKHYATLNRIDGTYSRGETENILASIGMGFDFFDIQEALYGNIIIPDSITFYKERTDYVLNSTVPPFDITYKIDGSSMDLKTIHMIDQNNKSITVYFDDYRKIEDKTTFAYTRSYVIHDPALGDTKLDLKFKKVELDKSKKTRFTVPPHYEEVY